MQLSAGLNFKSVFLKVLIISIEFTYYVMFFWNFVLLLNIKSNNVYLFINKKKQQQPQQ